MEHIVQFAISIDEERIKAFAAESAAKDVKEELENILIAKGSWTDQYFTTYAEDIFKKVVNKALNDHIDYILDEAVKQIVGSIKNSKKYKVALDSVAKEIASTTKE